MKPVFLLGLLLLPWFGSAHAAPRCIAAASTAQGNLGVDDSPAGTAVAFYRWYVHALGQPGAPPSLSDPSFKALVSPGLRQKLYRQRQSRAFQEQDYFLRAQDVPEDWQGNIAAEPAHIRGRIATTTVTLGATEKSRRQLLVTLVRLGQRWKIDRVGTP